MIRELNLILEGVLLRLAVCMGPVLCILSGAMAFVAWWPSTPEDVRLQYLVFSFFFGLLAMWGIAVGPTRVERAIFLMASILNAGMGIVVLDGPQALPHFSIPFFVYSFWQFYVFQNYQNALPPLREQ